MVRDYVRKTERQKWSTEKMESAIKVVINEEMSLVRAATQFGVPKTTLLRYKNQKLQDPTFRIDKTKGKFTCVFSAEQELELVVYLKAMERRLFGLTMQDFRSVAFQLAVKNGLDHSFNKDKKMAGKDWMAKFMDRHPELSLRKPEATSGGRAMGFNRVNVSRFFELLTSIVEKHKITADRIYNCDETGITVNPKGHSKIIASKGKRQVGALKSAERGETVTAELCFSASGAYMSPMLIFPRKRMQKEFELGLPPGSWAEAHETGWINTEIFTRWFRKFIKFSKASKENTVLLILDGHSTHTKNIEVIDLARDNGVVLLCLPPHASHRLQPLDVSLMKPISCYYEAETRKWLRTNPGKVITLWQVASLFGSAFVNAATMRTAMKGFEKTGIWPLDMSVFTEDDFLPSAPTDIDIVPRPPMTAEDELDSITQPKNPTTEALPPSPSLTASTLPIVTVASTPNKPIQERSQPGCSRDTGIAIEPATPSSFVLASPESVLAVPKVSSQKQRKVNRKRGKAEILTDSPYKNELNESLQLIKRKKEEKEIKAATRNLKFSSNVNGKTTAKKSTMTSKKNIAAKQYEEDESESSDSSDAECLYCNEFYSKSIEGWIACVKCHKWAHNSCGGIDEEDDDTVFICEFCR
ncbi:uncharacterized protein LOC108916477 [Anoplophora glabripennis]|uniref:uncharacterized protein LOC108916477 n=1 Tax=Anoplophora glabripennis TaxID=217634 RepID=UPI000873C355|nr:uncharacterized protein LOC108916477 [Anoplophora glabripennis]